MNRSQALELLQELFAEVHEDFPAQYLQDMSLDELLEAVQDMRAYVLRCDLDRDEFF